MNGGRLHSNDHRQTRFGLHPSITILFWPRSRNARRANTRLALCPLGFAKRNQFFTLAPRKETARPVRSAIMRILFEVAPYDFRP